MKTTGSVQEKNGRFYFVINLYDANGKRKIKWISTGLTVRGNKRKAESMLREVLLHYDETGELPTGRGGAYEKVDAKTAKPLPQPLQPANKSEMPFLDYLNEWVQVHKASIQPATFISYNRMITGRITQYFEPLGLKLCEVTPQVLDEFQEKILLEGYTTNTVIHYHAIFGKAFKDAVRKDYLETNPMLKVDRPKKNSFRPNFYSKDEVQQLLEVSQDDPLHLCILITAYYGLRRSEVLGLKWSSIDFERKSITINHKVTEQLVNGKYIPVVSDVMKNKTSCRTLPLIPAVEEELLKQKEKQQLYRKLFKKSYSTEYLDFVCTDQEGKLIRPNFVTEHFDWLLRKYSLPRIRFHDLRHPYVKHTTKIFSLRLMDFQAQAYPDARRKIRGACQLHRGGQSRIPVRPFCNRKQFPCLPPQAKMSWILYAISMRLSGYTSTRSISSSASSVVSVSASKIALDASFRLSCRTCSSCFCFACANTAA